jgi:hypothetical protein
VELVAGGRGWVHAFAAETTQPAPLPGMVEPTSGPIMGPIIVAIDRPGQTPAEDKFHIHINPLDGGPGARWWFRPGANQALT